MFVKKPLICFVYSKTCLYISTAKVWGAALKADDGNITDRADGRIYVSGIDTQIGVVDEYSTYYKAEVCDGDGKIYNDGVAFDVALAYKGADAATAGTWGLSANYFD